MIRRLSLIHASSIAVLSFLLLSIKLLSFAGDSSDPIAQIFSFDAEHLNFDQAKSIFEGKYTKWDGLSGSKPENAIDYVHKDLPFKGNESSLGLLKLNSQNDTDLVFSVSLRNPEYRCLQFHEDVSRVYGQNVLHYFDSETDSIGEITKVEATFDQENSRTRFFCFGTYFPGISKFVGIASLRAGKKKTIPKTVTRKFIKCEADGKWTQGIKDDAVDRESFFYYIDEDDKKLLKKSGFSVGGNVKEFSDRKIYINDETEMENRKIKKNSLIDRITGEFYLDIIQYLNEEQQLYLNSKTAEKVYKGFCEPHSEAKKF